MLMGRRVVELRRDEKLVVVDTGQSIGYDFLVLATGARLRTITSEPVPGLLYLRTIADARLFKTKLAEADSLIAIGAGFIGLEAAAAAAVKGKRVTVVAAEDRPMSRVVSPLISAYFAELHSRHGVRMVLSKAVTRVEPGVKIHLGSGETLEAPLAIAGIGVVPNSEIALGAGLATSTSGIIVDEYLRTSDDSIFAIGDCADHPNRFALEGRCRLESVQNAVDQARSVASTIAGKPRAYGTVPWFWTEQFEHKLQIAGIPASCDHFVVRGDKLSEAFSVFGFMESRLGSVESINRPVDHIQGRKLLDLDAPLTPAQAADPAFELKHLTRAGTGIRSTHRY
jgi:3-phenylpropionate/trans-cinnamate dioxygenase ferredoxin reductase subunit